MDASIKKIWIAALRSGKYRQMQGTLKGVECYDEQDEPTGEAFCCLGVLREISGIQQIDTGAQYLDPVLSGLSEVIQSDLARLNDVKRADFNEIADYIEKEVA